MANFFDAFSGRDVTVLSVTKGSKFRIGLYGGAPGGVRLNVTTAKDGSDAKAPDPAVKFITEQGTWRLIYEIDSNRVQSERVRACWDGNDYSAPVALTIGAAVGAGAGKAEVRRAIVQLARTFVPNAHYLWGTAGNTPGSADGNPGGGKMSAAVMRSHSLSPSETAKEKVLGVCMAVQPRFDGYNTCAGRSRGRTGSLDGFLKACQEKIDAGQTDQTTWPGGGPGNLYPRKYHFRGDLAGNGTVVWGESCAGVRHFDCVGLVNYCYGKHWYKGAFGLDIKFFRNPMSGTVSLTGNSDLMDADILIKPGDVHIGMLFRNGQSWSVVQAESTEIGLTDTAVFNHAEWDRYRMQDAFLV